VLTLLAQHIAQAVEYGVAQSRPRIIFLAARSGEPLPDFPLQTHAGFKKATPKQFKVEGCDARITTCRCVNGAPLPAVTAGAVLSDLPMFDWMSSCEQRPCAAALSITQADPHVIYPDKNDEHDRWRRERAKIIPSFEVPKRGESDVDRIGPQSPCAYRCQPRTSHQLALRQLVPGSAISSSAYKQQVTQHQTTVLSLDASERVCNVKLAPNANYDTWPPSKPKLASWGYSSLAAASARKNSAYPKAYLRADPAGALQISMARMDPGSKSGGNLHWDQYRLLTVREVARAQCVRRALDLRGEADHRCAEVSRTACTLRRSTALAMRSVRSAVSPGAEVAWDSTLTLLQMLCPCLLRGQSSGLSCERSWTESLRQKMRERRHRRSGGAWMNEIEP
jgi:site-specific DNA-cytosine methylase